MSIQWKARDQTYTARGFPLKMNLSVPKNKFQFYVVTILIQCS